MNNKDSNGGTFRNLILVAGLLVLAVFSIGCDKNIARPEDLAALTSVSIAELSVGNDTLIVGESTTITWSVEDADDVVEAVEITPDVGTVTTSDTRQISPEVTTVYTLNVYVDGEIAKSRSVSVKVLDASGDELAGTPSVSDLPTSETACTDDADDDGDAAIDCEDSDCVNDTACAAPVYAFTSVTVTPAEITDEDPLLVGETVTITWGSTCSSVKVDRDNVTEAKHYDASGDDAVYTFVAEDAATEITLICLNADGGEAETHGPIAFDATTVLPDLFDAEVDFDLSPSSALIYGQSYTLTWSVDNASTQTLDGTTVNSSDNETYTATTSKTHTLTVTDKHGNPPEDFTESVTVAAFDSTGVDTGSPTKVVPGDADGEFYFIGDSAITHTADYLVTVDSVSKSGTHGTLASLVESNGNIFVGTSAGLYVRAADGTSFSQAISTGSSCTFTALYAKSDGTILAGSDCSNGLGEVTSCSSSSGYCITAMSSFPGTDDAVISAFFKNPSRSSYVIAISDEGVFESSDGGDSFAQLAGLNDVVDGSWSSQTGGYLWSEDEIYEWNGTDFDQIDVSVSGINDVIKAGSVYYIASDDGVRASTDGEESFQTNLDGEVVLFLVGTSSTTATVNAVKDDGSVDALSFSGSQFLNVRRIGVTKIGATINFGALR